MYSMYMKHTVSLDTCWGTMQGKLNNTRRTYGEQGGEKGREERTDTKKA